jgi:hypothetical protein
MQMFDGFRLRPMLNASNAIKDKTDNIPPPENRR